MTRAARLLAFLAVLTLLVAGCGGGGKKNNGSGNGASPANGAKAAATPSPGPAAVAHDWVEAAFNEDGDTLSTLTCPAKKGDVTAGKISITAFLIGSNVLISATKPRITKHDLTYSVASQQGDQADVHVNGSLVVSEALISHKQEVKNKTMHMQHEASGWTWCGF